MCRMCLRTLVVSEDAVLRFLYERKWEMVDAGYREARGQWLGRFVRFLMAAEKMHLRVSVASLLHRAACFKLVIRAASLCCQAAVKNKDDGSTSKQEMRTPMSWS